MAVVMTSASPWLEDWIIGVVAPTGGQFALRICLPTCLTSQVNISNNVYSMFGIFLLGTVGHSLMEW